MKGCCFTGYRPEKMPFPYDGEDPRFILFREKTREIIKKALKAGYDTFYCGGAKGFDLFAAEMLLSFRGEYDFRLIMVLPYRAQADGFSYAWRAKYFKVLLASDENRLLSEEYHPRCFADRNEYMVDRSELVIAFCDGQKGGTLNTIRYARRNGKAVVNVFDSMNNMTLIDEI